MSEVQIEKGRIFHLASRTLLENGPDGVMRISKRGEWFWDYANEIPSSTGWQAFEKFVRTLAGFKPDYVVTLTIPGEDNEQQQGRVMAVVHASNERQNPVRVFDVGRNLKRIVENEGAWLKDNDLNR